MIDTHPVILNGQYNIGHICTRLQCELGRGDRVAFRFLTPALERTDYTFSQLDQESSRWANLLAGLGIGAGEVVCTYLPRLPEQFFAFLGILKRQAVACTLFANFGEDALLDRMADSRARCVITKTSLLRRLRPILPRLPDLKCVLLVDAAEHQAETILSAKLLKQAAPAEFSTPLTGPDVPSVLHYTSGSTGKPKGVQHVHRSILSQNQTAREVLDLRAEDVYWCTADQGWVTGISYGIIGPWSLGVTQVHNGGAYDAEAWFTILEREGVTVWYTAPTALRMLMREDQAVFQNHRLPNLRRIYSVGEPLNPEVISWGEKTLGQTIYDTWFQTETGAIMITNRPGLPVCPGSMGKPIRGVEAAVLREDGSLAEDGEQGSLCLKPGWASQFVTYLNHPEVYAEKFRHGYYFTGDTAYRDPEGYFWFMGRSDDVINTAGHLVSPFEVESALLEIPEVGESGVIGAPDDLLFEKVVAFISLKENVTWSRDLELKIRLYISNRVSSTATPQDFRIVPAIPKNKSGKIMRRVLKAWYTGADAGDLSTLED